MSVMREHLHTRSVAFNGYKRSDGLWDIESEMSDVRHYETWSPEKATLPAGQPIHNIAIQVTLDDQLTIQTISVRMKHTPFQLCAEVESRLQGMVGVTMGNGWRRTINLHLGGTQNCSHLRELLYNMATVAFQTIPVYHAQTQRKLGRPPEATTEPPYFLGQCSSWRLDGPVVQRFYPQFYKIETGKSREH